MTLSQLMHDTKLINDDTELVIRGQGWKRRGNWYEDHMLTIVSEYGESLVRDLHFRDYLDIGRVVEVEIRER
ncbi:MAG: hypothetical protein IKG04_01365 [Exiguobacterium sp.]|nr:hypothetical protein [Exiguobacterium sp.]